MRVIQWWVWPVVGPVKKIRIVGTESVWIVWPVVGTE